MGNSLFKSDETLARENNLLKNRIIQLENKINQLNIQMQQNNQESKKKELEEFYKNLDKSVDKYVNEMLKDDEINSVLQFHF